MNLIVALNLKLPGILAPLFVSILAPWVVKRFPKNNLDVRLELETVITNVAVV
jgi:hypothetical protein